MKKENFHDHKALSLFDRIVYFRRKLLRQAYGYSELQKKEEIIPFEKLTPSQKAQIKEVWGDVAINERWVSFYNHFNTEGWSPYYVPDDIHHTTIDMHYNDYKKSMLIDDKNLYELFFHGVRVPKTYFRKVDGQLQNGEYEIVTMQEVTKIIETIEKGCIFKPSITSCSGRNILIWRKGDDINPLLSLINKHKDFIVQELIEQHEVMNKLHAKSVNTIRIVTWTRLDEVVVLSASVRMGVGDSELDNMHQGGIFCGIQEDGRLKEIAHNGIGQTFDQHPQGARFAEIVIPNYGKVKSLVKSLAPRLARFSKLIAWDIAICKDGEPLVVEANLDFTGLESLQIANGPFYGKYTKEMIKEVFGDKTNRRLTHIYRFLSPFIKFKR